jgi:preprotein translocase subunit SecF
VAAIITTLHDVLICVGWFALSGHEFDLNVLAGILSVMGFSINDTIVVFDRVRENFRGMRADPVTILNKSVNQTLSRTVITSFVAFLTCSRCTSTAATRCAGWPRRRSSASSSAPCRRSSWHARC